MNLDKAIEAATEALIQYDIDNPGQEWSDFGPAFAAALAVEAAAPLIRENWGNVVWELQHETEKRAERAEAELSELHDQLGPYDTVDEAIRAAAENSFSWEEARNES